jgi:hypothetical protein
LVLGLDHAHGTANSQQPTSHHRGADRVTLPATAALALSQVNRVIAAVRGQEELPDPGPPTALNAMEFDLTASTIVARQWTRHPLCSC